MTQEMWAQSLSQEYPLEKSTATHARILAGRIPWTEEPGRLWSMGCKELDMTKHTHKASIVKSVAPAHKQTTGNRTASPEYILEIKEASQTTEVKTVNGTGWVSQVKCLYKTWGKGASLVVHRWRICLPMQQMQVQSLHRELWSHLPQGNQASELQLEKQQRPDTAPLTPQMRKNGVSKYFLTMTQSPEGTKEKTGKSA